MKLNLKFITLVSVLCLPVVVYLSHFVFDIVNLYILALMIGCVTTLFYIRYLKKYQILFILIFGICIPSLYVYTGENIFLSYKKSTSEDIWVISIGVIFLSEIVLYFFIYFIYFYKLINYFKNYLEKRK